MNNIIIRMFIASSVILSTQCAVPKKAAPEKPVTDQAVEALGLLEKIDVPLNQLTTELSKTLAKIKSELKDIKNQHRYLQEEYDTEKKRGHITSELNVAKVDVANNPEIKRYVDQLHTIQPDIDTNLRLLRDFIGFASPGSFKLFVDMLDEVNYTQALLQIVSPYILRAAAEKTQEKMSDQHYVVQPSRLPTIMEEKSNEQLDNLVALQKKLKNIIEQYFTNINWLLQRKKLKNISEEKIRQYYQKQLEKIQKESKLSEALYQQHKKYISKPMPVKKETFAQLLDAIKSIDKILKQKLDNIYDALLVPLQDLTKESETLEKTIIALQKALEPLGRLQPKTVISILDNLVAGPIALDDPPWLENYLETAPGRLLETMTTNTNNIQKYRAALGRSPYQGAKELRELLSIARQKIVLEELEAQYARTPQKANVNKGVIATPEMVEPFKARVKKVLEELKKSASSAAATSKSS